jgi:hypothetical protein
MQYTHTVPYEASTQYAQLVPGHARQLVMKMYALKLPVTFK